MKKIKILFTLSFVISNYNFSQILDLNSCLFIADTANLSIRAAQLDVAINKKQIAVYNAARLPKLSLNGDYKYNTVLPNQLIPSSFFGGPAGSYNKVRFGVPYNLSSTLLFTQVLYNPQMNYGIQALNLNQKIFKIQEQQSNLEIKYQVANLFFNIQAVKRQINFLESNYKNLQKIINNSKLLLNEGLIIETEVDKLNINLLNIENSIQVANSNKEQLLSLLKIFLGFNENSSIDVVDDELNQKTLILNKLDVSRPELALLNTQLTLNKETKKGTNMAYLPSLSFYAAYNYTFNINPSDKFKTGIESSFIGLKLDWTLFDGTEKIYSQKKNKLEKEKLEIQKELLIKQINQEIENNRRQIDIHLKSLEIAKKQIELSEKIYNQSQKQFELGTISTNDLINAENSLSQSQTNLITAFIQLRQAELNYLKSIGIIK